MAIVSFTTVRVIQWFGVVDNPTPEGFEVRGWRLEANLLRRPAAEYINSGIYNLPQGLIGNIQTIYSEWLGDTFRFHYKHQIYQKSFDSRFLHGALACSTDLILQSFENLVLALPIPPVPVSRFNEVREWPPLEVMPDRFAIRCVSENTVVQLKLTTYVQETCGVDGNPPPPPPPIEPPPFEPEPPDSPFPSPEIIDPPYDPTTNDGGLTYVPEPNPPINPELPFGIECETYEVTVVVDLGFPEPQTFSGFFLGPIYAVYQFEDNVRVDSSGIPGTICNPPDQVTGDIVTNNVVNLISFTVQLAQT
jgi:hypothetical protein